MNGKTEKSAGRIRLLDEKTIGKIAAGEVVERPAAVAKELIENAIDAGADAVTCEIDGGGIRLLRVTDNGCGILPEDIEAAFTRHATSKITAAEDLTSLHSLGFRGEALSSIAAVSRVEMITKRRENASGVHVENVIMEGSGGDMPSLETEEVGAPDGTTVIVRDLFLNVPVRRKFLKTAVTEAGYITDIIEHLALSHPDVSFHYRVNGKDKLHTTGNGDVKEIIYRIFGKETHDGLLPVSASENGLSVSGFIGRPQISRASRQSELFFVNGRSVSSGVLSAALEEGYGTDLMQRRFPFSVLYLELPPERVDVNIHPSKKEVRFEGPEEIYGFICSAVRNALKKTQLIRRESFADAAEERVRRRDEALQAARLAQEEPVKEPFLKRSAIAGKDFPNREESEGFVFEDLREKHGPHPEGLTEHGYGEPAAVVPAEAAEEKAVYAQEKFVFTEENASRFQLIGQVFGTYWIIEFEDRLLLIDQHAAHEKVNFERIMKQAARQDESGVPSQLLSPPVMVQLSGSEESVLLSHGDAFRRLGFEFEEMGDGAYALRAVPLALYGNAPDRLFLDTIHEILAEKRGGMPKDIVTQVATMSCKAAVKGNTALTRREAEALIRELLALDNPFHCPHGRPTMIEMKKEELERKFKRIV